MQHAAASGDYGRRNLPVIGFLALVVAWLAVIKITGQLVANRADLDDGRMLTSEQVFWALIVPIGAACAFVYLVITILGWWRPVFYDPKPVRKWVWVIPLVFVVGIVGGINYGGLADRGLGFTLALLCAGLLVGFSEEGMFRVIGVTSLRRNGLTEGKVALWSSVAFGLAHIANVIGGDPRAFAQAVAVSFAGYFFYLIRRVSRSNILNSVIHGMFDFTIISGTQIIPEGEYGLCGLGACHLCVPRLRIDPSGSPPLDRAALARGASGHSRLARGRVGQTSAAGSQGAFPHTRPTEHDLPAVTRRTRRSGCAA